MFLVETKFYYVGQAGLKLLTSCDTSASASQSAGITSVSHCAQPSFLIYLKKRLSFLNPNLQKSMFQIGCILPKNPTYLIIRIDTPLGRTWDH